jgi:Arm DNA-binding domain
MKRRFATNLHRLSVRQVQVALDGDYTDGGGLILRVKNGSAVWVLRFTAPSGRRREMGLGRVDRNNAQAIGNSLTHARQQAQDARAKLQQSIDPIDSRWAERQAAKEAARKVAVARGNGLTLARACRSYFERVVEGNRSERHERQWLASLE